VLRRLRAAFGRLRGQSRWLTSPGTWVDCPVSGISLALDTPAPHVAVGLPDPTRMARLLGCARSAGLVPIGFRPAAPRPSAAPGGVESGALPELTLALPRGLEDVALARRWAAFARSLRRDASR
jgi:hypothetical protein